MPREEKLQRLRWLVDQAAASDGQRRAAILAQVQRVSAGALREVVAHLRDEGMSWRDIARGLGVSHATLHERYQQGRDLLVTSQVPRRVRSRTARRDKTAAGTDASRPKAQGSTDPPARLPAARFSSFVGRSRELADLRPLHARSRLITLTGPAGVGKTRLAEEYVRSLGASFAGRVWWVSLAPIAPDGSVHDAVAAAVSRGQPAGWAVADVVNDASARGRTLVVLDNCEHVVEDCRKVVVALLDACARLTVLATSREALSIPGERTLPVTPLAVPDPAVSYRRDLRQLPAVRLFTDRATAALPDFSVSDETLDLVVGVCRELDGLPLAIELAASRVPLLGVRNLHASLRDRLALLDLPATVGLHKDHSLRDAIDWSYQLLTAAEQTTFRRLSVYADGFDLAGAQAVCVDGQDVAPAAVLNLLARLHSKSLIVTTTVGAQPRFRLLESIRLYAWNKLVEAGDLPACQDRVIGWFYGIIHAYLYDGDTGANDRNEHLFLERENLRTAVNWAQHAGDPRYTGLVILLRSLCTMAASVRQAKELLTRAIDSGTGPASDQAFALAVLAGYEIDACRYESAVELGARAIERAHQAGCVAALDEGIAYTSYAYASLGQSAQARKCMAEHLEINRRVSGPWWTAVAQLDIAMCLICMSEWDEAADVLAEAEPVLRSGPETSRVWTLLSLLGLLAIARQDLDGAQRAYTELLDGVERQLAGMAAPLVPAALEGLAVVAGGGHDHDRALTLAATAEAMRERFALPRPPYIARHVAPALEHSRQCVADPDSAQSRTSGWTEADIIAYALGRTAAPVVSATVLTAREQQVAELVVAGFTNGQVAARLGVTDRTIAFHLGNIRTKLNAPGRAHIVAWVLTNQRRHSG